MTHNGKRKPQLTTCIASRSLLQPSASHLVRLPLVNLLPAKALGQNYLKPKPKMHLPTAQPQTPMPLSAPYGFSPRLQTTAALPSKPKQA